MYRDEILKNRETWIEGLLNPESKGFTGWLENLINSNERCCLGHGCHYLGLTRSISNSGRVLYEKRFSSVAPEKLVELVGLWNDIGATSDEETSLRGYPSLISLIAMNDQTTDTPQCIGKYLQSVIEGGPDTPFRPLTAYPEAPECS
jgi:hypothetical protein